MNDRHDMTDPELISALKRNARRELPEFSSRLHARIMRAVTQNTPGAAARDTRRVWIGRSLALAAGLVMLAVALSLAFNYPARQVKPAADTAVAADLSTLLSNPNQWLDQASRPWRKQLAGTDFTNVPELVRRLTDYTLDQLTLSGGPEIPHRSSGTD